MFNNAHALRDPHSPERRTARLIDLLYIHTGIVVPVRSVCPNHSPPALYLLCALRHQGNDLVVWACRGGGKTLLAAAATWAELTSQPHRCVRILAASRDQGRILLDYLRTLAERLPGPSVAKDRNTSIILDNNSRAEVLAHAHSSVRGHHVDTLRLDEVELFKDQILHAAMFTADRPGPIGQPPDASPQPGRVEALSTMHRPAGPMGRLIQQACPPDHSRPPDHNAILIQWCLLDILERCPPTRPCASCPLWIDCQGRARNATGFFPIESAIRLRARTTRQAWEAEALCARPSLHDCVFPRFDPAIHVAPLDYDPALPLFRSIDLGFTNPCVCLFIQTDSQQRVRIINEVTDQRVSLASFAQRVLHATPGPVIATYCDPAAHQTSLLTANSAADQLRNAGLPIRSRPSRIIDGIERIRTALEQTTDNIPHLRISPRCTNLINSLQAYRYPPHHAQQPPSETPWKDGIHDHAIDALRYFYINHLPELSLRTTLY